MHGLARLALKCAIQIHYQFEDNELAAEPLPDEKHRHLLLIYEATEGGAGALRRLLDEPEALSEVAREALRCVTSILIQATI